MVPTVLGVRRLRASERLGEGSDNQDSSTSATIRGQPDFGKHACGAGGGGLMETTGSVRNA